VRLLHDLCQLIFQKALHKVARRESLVGTGGDESVAPRRLRLGHGLKVVVGKAYKTLRAFACPRPCLDCKHLRNDLTAGVLTPRDYIDGPLVGIDIKAYWASHCGNKFYPVGHSARRGPPARARRKDERGCA
jgi:hypothetical protein